MYDYGFNNAAQIAADNDLRDIMALPVPDPIVLELRFYDSELQPLLDELMEHHFITGKIADGWAITRATVRQALIAHIKAQFNDMTIDWGADDHMHGDNGTALQREILEIADKVAPR